MSAAARYEMEKRSWLWLHPNATPEQIEAACKAIARRCGL